MSRIARSWTGTAREYVYLLRAVRRECPTWVECQNLKQPLPDGGCSCPAHGIFNDTELLARLVSMRRDAARLHAEENFTPQPPAG